MQQRGWTSIPPTKIINFMLCGLWTPGTRLEGSVERGGSSSIRSIIEPEVKTMQNFQANLLLLLVYLAEDYQYRAGSSGTCL